MENGSVKKNDSYVSGKQQPHPYAEEYPQQGHFLQNKEHNGKYQAIYNTNYVANGTGQQEGGYPAAFPSNQQSDDMMAMSCPKVAPKKSKSPCPPPKPPCPGEIKMDCRKEPCVQGTGRTCGPVIKATDVSSLFCNREFVCDEYGVGTRPKSSASKRTCCVPLTSYQEVHGELAKKILTAEICTSRYINPPPPCSICEEIMPPCRGFYRPYECIKPEEYDEAMMALKDGKPVMRNAIERYWNPCLRDTSTQSEERADLAGHNVGLMKRLQSKRGYCL